MSSVVLWSCPVTGVTASWNKDGDKWTCFVPTHESAEFPGVLDGITTSYSSKERVIAAAKRKAEEIKRDRGVKSSSGNTASNDE